MKKNKSKDAYNELLPPRGDPSLGYKVFTLLASIIEDKAAQKLSDKWNRNYELGRNKHWKSDTKKTSLISANLLHVHRQRSVNMLTDNNPTFNVVRQSQVEDEQVFTKLLRVAEFWWIDQEQQAVLEKSVLAAETYGCTVRKSVFNPELEFGLGEIETERIDPYNFGVWPLKFDDTQKAEANFHYPTMSVREARRRWPKFAKHIQPDSEYLSSLNDTRREIAGGKPKGEPKSYFSTFGGVVKEMLNNAGGSDSDDDELLICECWSKDYSRQEDGTPVYPGFIRVVTTCNGGKVVLDDRGNPSINPELDTEQAQKTYLYDKYPFILTASITDALSPWGMSDFEQLEQLQMEINKSMSQITMLKDKAARLKLINPLDSGVPNAHFTTRPGIIRPTSAMVAAGIRYLDLPTIPGDIVNTLEMYREFFFLVAGSFDLEQAQTPGREVIAHKAIAALIERANTMMKGKIRNYGKMIRETGRMFLSHAMNWYTEERYVEYKEDGEAMVDTVTGPDLIVPAKLTVVSGSTMPRSKVQERDESLELFKMGAIDQTELLKKIDWTDWPSVVKRMEQGPIGQLLEKAQMLGLPEPMMQLFQELSQMEAKDVEKAVQDGQLPSFDQIIEAMTQDPEAQEQEQGDPLTEADVSLKHAQIGKEQAETELVVEKIRTEQVDQFVKKSGVQFDQEKLRIEKAQTISDISSNRDRLKLDKANTVVGIKERLENQAAQKAETSKSVAKKAQDSKPVVKKADQIGTKPYQEKGLASNNKKVGDK